MSSPIGYASTTPLRTRTVQGIHQLSATLLSTQFPDPQKRFEEARSLTLWWMNRRVKNELNRGIPPPAWSGESFEVDQHGQLYAAVTVPDLNLWTCRLEHDDPEVAARTWSVDIALRQVGSEVIFLERTLCVSPANCIHPAPQNVPRIIRDLVTKVGLSDVVPITGNPWYLTTPGDLDLLQLLLSDNSRLLPVIMLTEADEISADRGYKVARFVLDPVALAKELLGLAHAVVMPRELGFEWTKRVGRSWTAFYGAIRTYRPGLSFSDDDPYRHPLAKLDEIVLWEHQTATGEKLHGEPAFQAFLREKMFQTVTSRPLRQEDTLFYRYAKVRGLSAATTPGKDSSPAEEELRLEVSELRKQLDEERGEKDYVYNYSADLEETLQRAEKERFSLRAQLEALRAGFGDAARERIPLPDSLDDLEDWEQNVAGQIWIAPRAISAAGKSGKARCHPPQGPSGDDGAHAHQPGTEAAERPDSSVGRTEVQADRRLLQVTFLHSSVRNNSGLNQSYGVLTGEPSALQFIEAGACVLQHGARVVLSSNGLKPLWDMLGWGATVPGRVPRLVTELLRTSTASAILDMTEDAERKNKSVRSDDKTVLMIDVD
jgi:hypothetical protein